MIVNRNRRFTVRMGDFESYQFGASVTVGPEDVGLTAAELAALDEKEYAEYVERMFELCDSTMVEALLDDVREAASLTDDQRSFIKRAVSADQPRASEPRAIKPRAIEPRTVRRV